MTVVNRSCSAEKRSESDDGEFSENLRGVTPRLTLPLPLLG
jgi:hypothetical protein